MKLNEREERLIRRTFLDYQQTSEFLKTPLVVNKAEGLYYWDTEGKRYFDAIGGIFAASLGHQHPRVTGAVHRQLDRITLAPPLHSISDVTLEFVEKLGAVAPDNLNYVKPFSGGSESIECAMKFVRQYFRQTGHSGKYKIISRYLAYHGGTFAAMAASGSGSRKAKFEPEMPGFLKVHPPISLRDQFSSWEECNRFAASMFEEAIINEGPETVAAILVEPIGNTGGVVMATEEYFQILRRICDKYNVVLIFDEIITGYGRTGEMFGAQSFNVTPDIICGGKGLSSGVVPLGAMIAREDMAETFFGPAGTGVEFAHGHTYAGNPLACAAGIAVVDEIVEKKLDQKAKRLGVYLEEKLQKLKKYGVIREIRGMGLLWGMELVKDTESNTPFPELGKALKKTALENGVIMRINPTWFAIAPALTAETSDIDKMVELVEKSLADAIEAVEREPSNE